MEIGPYQSRSGLRRTSHHFRVTVVITLHSQTEFVINAHTTVSGTHTVVSGTRTIVHGQEGNDNKVSVGNIYTSTITK